MSNRPRGLATATVRAAVLPVLLVATVAASLLGTRLVVANSAPSEAGFVVPSEPAWTAAYSRRFPGCVATVLWPAAERPVAFVVRERSAEVIRISLREALQRAEDASRADGATTIGVCRRR